MAADESSMARNSGQSTPSIPPLRIRLADLARWLEQIFRLTGEEVVRDVVLALRGQQRVFVEFENGGICSMFEWQHALNRRDKQCVFDWSAYEAVADPEWPRLPLVTDWEAVEHTIA
jgi:hypothetical protein